MLDYIGKRAYEDRGLYNEHRDMLKALDKEIGEIEADLTVGLRMYDRAYASATAGNMEGVPIFRAFMEQVGFDSLSASRDAFEAFASAKLAEAKKKRDDLFKDIVEGRI